MGLIARVTSTGKAMPVLVMSAHIARVAIILANHIM